MRAARSGCCVVQATADSLTKACKCHGVSGSCSVRTCWKSLPDLRVVASTLLDSYSQAVEVDYRRVARVKVRAGGGDSAADTPTQPTEKRLVPVTGNRKNFTDDDLIFYTMSPDYCLPDASLGSVGTKDR